MVPAIGLATQAGVQGRQRALLCHSNGAPPGASLEWHPATDDPDAPDPRGSRIPANPKEKHP